MRFLLDEDVFPCLKFILEEWKHEAVSAALRPDLAGEPDEHILATAVSEGRVVITFNIEHFEELHQDYRHTAQKHPGIIVCRHVEGYENFHRLLRWMRNILQTVPLVQFPNTIYHLHNFG